MRYAIISDIHGNLAALTSVLQDLEQRSVDAVVCLGDVVGYYADSQAVIDMLRDHLRNYTYSINGQECEGQLWLQGNHERGLLDHHVARHFTDTARKTLEQTRSDLAPESLELLGNLPEKMMLQLTSALRATLVHATPSDPVGVIGYIENAEDARLAIQELEERNTPLCIVGHTHRPSIFYATDRIIGATRMWKEIFIGENFVNTVATPHELRLPAVINPGSVGQPRDGDNRASYGILDVTQQVPTFTIYRVVYNIDDTVQRVQAWLRDVPDSFWDHPGSLTQRLTRGL
ncbi:metallophosphoesterase family protein [bacterium]|nr:metallophosphoesterase family protein [bacterium]